MRLLRLSANKPSFRTVDFHREGLSLVVAEQKSKRSERTATYNGVGKSLMLEIIHYCLGSNKKVAFEKHLSDWVFYLTVEIDGARYEIGRSAGDASKITLAGDDITLRKLKEFLEKGSLESKPEIPHLTFRSIVPRFIRSSRSAYVAFSYASEGESKKPYAAMLRTAYLLGLDLPLAKAKFDLRKRREDLTDTMKQLEKEPVFAELLAEDSVDIQLNSLRERAEKLQDDLESFKVAEDYHEIEQDANAVKRKLDGLRRESIKFGEAIAQIERSLQTKGDLPLERVFQLYQEAEASLPNALRRRVEEVVAFQEDLQTKRVYRLTSERQKLENELQATKDTIRSLSAQLDQKLGYLSEHRALDEYVAVNKDLTETRQQVTKLEESKALRDKVDRELKRIDRDIAEENLRTDDYLETARPLVEEATSAFRSYARRLYGKRPSGLSVSNDSGNNQLRYRIDAHITADAAEGINEAKIFCFDMMLLALQRGHRFRFLVHDSTLFGPVDPRQRLAMFQTAEEVCKDLGMQYIATLNLHDITSIREQTQADEGELDRLFGDDCVVLRLTDQSPSKRLLGIDVDMDYTK